MKLYVVEYRYAPDRADLRSAARSAHRAWIDQLADQGAIAATGPFTDGSGGLLIAWGRSSSDIAHIIADDPYVVDGLAETTIRQWTPVLGTFAQS